MCRSVIPPRTMRDVASALHPRAPRRSPVVRVRATLRRPKPPVARPAAEPEFPTGLLQKPRNWRFQTKPVFKKLHGPLVDVFDEADEVLIVIDLNGFSPADLTLSVTAEKYIVRGRRGSEVFHEEIALPPEVDLDRCVQQFRNGILEITLPRCHRDERPKGDP